MVDVISQNSVDITV